VDNVSRPGLGSDQLLDAVEVGSVEMEVRFTEGGDGQKVTGREVHGAIGIMSQIETQEGNYRMKKIMSLMLGLSLVTGTVAFSQEKKTGKSTSKSTNSKSTKKTGKTMYKMTSGSQK
jgi:hypothetical protein